MPASGSEEYYRQRTSGKDWGLRRGRDEAYNQAYLNLAEDQIRLLKERGELTAQGIKDMDEALSRAADKTTSGMQQARQEKRNKELHEAEKEREGRDKDRYQYEKGDYERKKRDAEAEDAYLNSIDPNTGKSNREIKREMERKQAELAIKNQEAQLAATNKQIATTGTMSPEARYNMEQQKRAEAKAELEQVSTMLANPNLKEGDRALLAERQARLLSAVGAQGQDKTYYDMLGQQRYATAQKQNETTTAVTEATLPGYTQAKDILDKADADANKTFQMVDAYQGFKRANVFQPQQEAVHLNKFISYTDTPEERAVIEESAGPIVGTKTARMEKMLNEKLAQLEKSLVMIKPKSQKFTSLQPQISRIEEQISVIKQALNQDQSATNVSGMRNQLQLQRQQNTPKTLRTGG